MFIDFLVVIKKNLKQRSLEKNCFQFSWISFIILIILRSLTSIRAWVKNLKQGKVGRSLKERKKEGFSYGFERKKMEKRNNKGKGSKNQAHHCTIGPNLANIV
jgi:hypothetical protein